MVKNAVIVPVGAKGGFVLKQTCRRDRDGCRPRAWPATGSSSRRCSTSPTTSSAGKIVPPRDVVRHDGDDPYLVVAADKGTATFSDIANEISVSTGSGSATRSPPAARPATTTRRWASPPAAPGSRSSGTSATWASTPRPQDFTVVGVGDMSGDVFGNGMLLSEHIRLVAAFDHRHIFLDPDPDAAASYAERRRLFDLPRSSWADYDASLISRGRRRLPADGQVDPDHAAGARGARPRRRPPALAPAELMRAILRGAGRPAVERRHRHLRQGGHRVARRRRRQGQRRDPGQRPAAAGQGGRRGRQPGPDPARPDRVRADRRSRSTAAAGGRIFTDFIDNSAGVDCSDHEVNIKILLGGAVADGELDRAGARRAAGRDDRRGRRAGAAGQLRPGHGAGQRPGAGRTRCCRCTAGCSPSWSGRASSTGELEALPTDEELGRAPRPATGSPRRSSRCCWRTSRSSLEREVLASTPAATRSGPATCWPATSRPRCASGSPTRMAGAPAAPRDRHHRAGQRGGQPRRHVVRVPGAWRRPARRRPT